MMYYDVSLEPRPINFIGGPIDGINYVSPAANCVLNAEGGRYIFDGTNYQWVTETPNQTEG